MRPLVIEVGSQAEADCVARALKDFGSDLRTRQGNWTVAVAYDKLDLAAVFAALEDCLRDNAIAAVRLSVGTRRYVMEAAS